MTLASKSPFDERHALQYAALAHPARLEILRCLARHPDRHCKCKDVVCKLPLAQSTVSQHLKVLVEAGLVTAKHSRPASQYSLDMDALAELGQSTRRLIDTCCKTNASPARCTPTEGAEDDA